MSGICRNEVIVPPLAAVHPSGSSRLKWLCHKMPKGGALSPTSQLLLPCEDETVENTIDFYSVGYHRIYINAVVTSVKIATDKALLKSI